MVKTLEAIKANEIDHTFTPRRCIALAAYVYLGLASDMSTPRALNQLKRITKVCFVCASSTHVLCSYLLVPTVSPCACERLLLVRV